MTKNEKLAIRGIIFENATTIVANKTNEDKKELVQMAKTNIHHCLHEARENFSKTEMNMTIELLKRMGLTGLWEVREWH